MSNWVKKGLMIWLVVLFVSTSIYAQDAVLISSDSGCTLDTVEIPVYIANPDTAVDSWGIDIHYDNTMLVYNSCLPGDLNPGWLFFGGNEISPGVIRVAGYSYSGAISQGSYGSLFVLVFTVACPGCSDGDFSMFQSQELVDDISDFMTSDGMFTFDCGSTPVPPTVTPTLTPLPPSPTYTSTPEPLDDEIWPGNSIGCSTDSIQVPIIISNPNAALKSFGVDVTFCTDMLDFDSASTGELNSSWLFFDYNEINPGVIRIGGFDSDEIPIGSQGSIAYLNFVVTCGSCTEGETCELELINLEDDVADWQTQNGNFTYSCISTATPTVTPTPRDQIMAGNAVGCITDQITLSIDIEHPDTPLKALGFDLYYDESKLTFQTCEKGDLLQEWQFFDFSEVAAGQLRIGAFNSTVIPVGENGTIIDITFVVSCAGCTEGDTGTFVIDRCVDDIAGWQHQNGLFTYSCIPTPTPTSTPEPNDLFAVGSISGCVGDLVSIPVTIDNPDQQVEAYGFDLLYDDTVLSFQSASRGTLVSGWTFFDYSLVAPGHIRIGAFGVPIIPTGSQGSIAALNFLVICSGCSEGDPYDLMPTQFVDDIEGWRIQPGIFTYSCLPTATPTEPPPPDDMIKIADRTGCQASFIQIPVTIDNPDNALGAFGFDFNFDPNTLSFQSCERGDLTSGFEFFDSNEIASGVMRVGGFSSPGVSSGSNGSIAVLNFLVTCSGCAEGDEFDLILTNLKDDVSEWNNQPGIFTYSCLPTATPTATPIPSNSVYITDTTGCTGDMIQLPVFIDNPDDAVSAFGFDLIYCSDMLDYYSCQVGTLTGSWGFIECNEVVPGTIRVGAYDLNAIPSGSFGTVVVLNFMVTCDMCQQGDQCEIQLTALVDDFVLFAPQNGMFTFMCPTPTPTGTPTNTPTPYPTYTPYPTFSPIPTFTPAPTYTPQTPGPTYTPAPTYTVNPTFTPQFTSTPMPTYTPNPSYTPLPTGTPNPTYTPNPTGTPVPTYTPNPPYPTHTPNPTFTPFPTYTASPSPTPLCNAMGVTISMPQAMFEPGDICYLEAIVCNYSDSTLEGYALFVVIEVGGQYHFWPTWTSTPDYLASNFPPGPTTVNVVGIFTWPNYCPEASGIMIYGALTDPDIQELVGTMDGFEFGWTCNP